MTDTLYLHGATYRQDGTSDAYWSMEVDSEKTELPRGQPVTGYGMRIPTRHMVKFNGKWRRVYCRCFSNVGTLYIGKLSKFGECIVVRDYA